jgi:hypothetical protein
VHKLTEDNFIVFAMNCYDNPSCQGMLYLKLEGYHEYLKPFIDYLNYTTDLIEYDGKMFKSTRIKSDPLIENTLRKL